MMVIPFPPPRRVRDLNSEAVKTSASWSGSRFFLLFFFGLIISVPLSSCSELKNRPSEKRQQHQHPPPTKRIRSVGDKQTICFACEIASEVHRPRESERERARDERRRARGNIQFGCYKHNSLCFRVLRDMLCFLQERKKKECLTLEQSFLLFSFKVWRRAMRRRCLRASVPFAHCSCTHDDQQRMLIGGNFNYFCCGQQMASPFFIPSARS